MVDIQYFRKDFFDQSSRELKRDIGVARDTLMNYYREVRIFS
jgi:hypothetical protein